MTDYALLKGDSKGDTLKYSVFPKKLLGRPSKFKFKEEAGNPRMEKKKMKTLMFALALACAATAQLPAPPPLPSVPVSNSNVTATATGYPVKRVAGNDAGGFSYGSNGEHVTILVHGLQSGESVSGEVLVDIDESEKTGVTTRYYNGGPEQVFPGIDYRVNFDESSATVSGVNENRTRTRYYLDGVQNGTLAMTLPISEFGDNADGNMKITVLIWTKGDARFFSPRMIPVRNSVGRVSVETSKKTLLRTAPQRANEETFNVDLYLELDNEFSETPYNVYIDGKLANAAMGNLFHGFVERLERAADPLNPGLMLRAGKILHFEGYPVNSLTPGVHEIKFEVTTPNGKISGSTEVFVRQNLVIP